MTQNYIHPDWQGALKTHDLDQFEKLWMLDVDWFEAPNIRRGGWSGVSRIEINHPTRGKIGLFLKRQENHRSRTWRHPISGIATLEKEFNNILRFQSHNIPSLTPVYYASKKVGGKLQAILITEELHGYQPLTDCLDSEAFHNVILRRQLLISIAQIMQKMHAPHFQHNCFFPKHIFVKQTDTGWKLKIIDLEKTKYRFSKQRVMLRDLGTLHRHAEADWSQADRIALLRAYMNESKLSAKSKRIAHMIAKKVSRKNDRIKPT